jgi:hypothetical protein
MGKFCNRPSNDHFALALPGVAAADVVRLRLISAWPGDESLFRANTGQAQTNEGETPLINTCTYTKHFTVDLQFTLFSNAVGISPVDFKG